MRKIDIYAQEHFAGNVHEAIKHLMHTVKSEEFKQYVEEFTTEEANFTIRLINNETIERVGGIEKYKQLYKREEQIQELNMTFEEIRDAKVNPYKQKIFKSLLGMLIMEGGVISLMLMGVPAATVGMLAAMSSGLLSMVVASNLVNYCKFKKVKKSIDREASENEFDKSLKGRGR